MLVKEIKSVEESKVKKLCVHLANCEEGRIDKINLIIDEENALFTAVITGNTAYTLTLSKENPIETLVTDLEHNADLLYEVLHNEILDGTIDVEETTETLINHIKRSNEYQENAEEYLPLQVMAVELESVLSHHYPFNIYMVDYVWDKWFEAYINDGLLPNLATLKANDYNLFELEHDFMCSKFCREHAPVIANALKLAYNL